MEKVKLKGLDIAYQCKGEGPPLVLLHGGLSDSRFWRRQIEAFSDEFTVVAWDAPGCGRSDDPPEGFSLADYADCLAALVDELDLDRPHVLGLSFGGGLALEFFNQYPNAPRTLVLASAYAGWAGSLPPEEVEKRVEKGLEQMDAPPEEVAEAWLPSLFGESAPAEAIEEDRRIMADFHPVGARIMLQAFAEADLTGMLSTIDVPTLLLYGENDQRSPLEVAESLHAQIPTSELVIMPSIGHVTSLVAPEHFNAEVRRFLNAHQN